LPRTGGATSPTLIEGDALETLMNMDDVFDVILLDAKKDEYERYFDLVRHLVDPGGLILADNVLSHEEVLRAYSEARQSDPTLLSVTLPLDSGLEVTSVLTP
jgi:predicted O-methyltransferase YrrM